MKCSHCRLWKTDDCTDNPEEVDFNCAEDFACFVLRDDIDDVVESTPEEKSETVEADTVVTDRYGTPVPMGWNWGAFILATFWAPRNNVPLRHLFRHYPFTQYYLGKHGSRLAWENGNWDSAEHFISVQRKWAKWGVALAGFWVLSMLAVVASALIAFLSF